MIDNKVLNAQPIKKPVSFGAKKAEKPAEQPEKSFSITRAGNQFYEGAVSPVKKIIEEGPEGIAIAGAVGVGTYKVIQKLENLNKNVRPVIAAAFATLGGMEIAKGAYKVASNAGNPEKQEKAFYDMGQGSTAVGLSLWGAQNAIGTKAAENATTKTAKFVDAVKRPVKSMAECFRKTAEMIKSNSKDIANTAFKAKHTGRTAAATTADTFDITDPTAILKTLMGLLVKPFKSSDKE